MAHWNQPYPHANAAPPASEATTLNLTLTLSTLSPDKAQRLTVAIRLVAQQVEAVHSLARARALAAAQCAEHLATSLHCQVHAFS